eukprot:3300165-Alexandrium_andersonii.AAC.1
MLIVASLCSEPSRPAARLLGVLQASRAICSPVGVLQNHAAIRGRSGVIGGLRGIGLSGPHLPTIIPA